MRKFTLFLMSLFLAVGAMAQFESGKYYRIKDNASGKYLNAGNHDEHASGTNGGVNVITLNEDSDEMLFTAIASGNGYKLKTRSGYYIVCQQWNVDASSTSDGSVLLFEQNNNGYIIKKNATQYFKVENVNGVIYPFCDAASSAAATWTIEEVASIEEPEFSYATLDKPTFNEGGNTTEVAMIELNGTNIPGFTYTKGQTKSFNMPQQVKAGKTYNLDLTYYMAYGDLAIFQIDKNSVEKKYGYYKCEWPGDPVELLAANTTAICQELGLNSFDELKTDLGEKYLKFPYKITIDENLEPGDITVIRVMIGKQGNGAYNAKGIAEGGCLDLVFEVSEAAAPATTETFEWDTNTEWETVGDCTSTVLNDEVLANGEVKYIETTLTTESAVDATITFAYSGGACALNVRGVEVINAGGYIVAGDYHVGKTGNSHENNIYEVAVAEAGTYTVRCYATFNSDNRANDTNGTITIKHREADTADFSHSMSIAAGYATLYLGYPVAIPAGVEAYVVSELTSTHAIMAQVNDVIPANTGVILKLAEGAAATATYTFAYTNDAADEIENNLLDGSIANCYVAVDACVLSNGDNGIGLYGAILNKLDDTAFLNNANKAYLQLPENAEGVASYSFRFDGIGTTAIENVEVENEVKVIYDLTGRKVETISAPGIYIVNGVKRVVR